MSKYNAFLLTVTLAFVFATVANVPAKAFIGLSVLSIVAILAIIAENIENLKK